MDDDELLALPVDLLDQATGHAGRQLWAALACRALRRAVGRPTLTAPLDVCTSGERLALARQLGCGFSDAAIADAAARRGCVEILRRLEPDAGTAACAAAAESSQWRALLWLAERGWRANSAMLAHAEHCGEPGVARRLAQLGYRRPEVWELARAPASSGRVAVKLTFYPSDAVDGRYVHRLHTFTAGGADAVSDLQVDGRGAVWLRVGRLAPVEVDADTVVPLIMLHRERVTVEVDAPCTLQFTEWRMPDRAWLARTPAATLVGTLVCADHSAFRIGPGACLHRA